MREVLLAGDRANVEWEIDMATKDESLVGHVERTCVEERWWDS